MHEKIKTLKLFTEVGFNRLEMAIKDLKEEHLDIESCPEANTIRWILTHLTEVLHVFVPKVLTGNKEYKPEGWPDDYEGNSSYSLEKILGDFESSKSQFFNTLETLDTKLLDEKIDWFYGIKTREIYLMLAISEIHHHEGQIAAILGVEKRMKGLH